MTQPTRPTQPSDPPAQPVLPAELLALLTEHLDVEAGVHDLSPERTLESLGMNSMSLMELVVAAEQEFGIVLPEDVLELSPSSTLGDAARAFPDAA
ncbi:acyl carrier protein [Streptomyces sp. CC224B]|uniref:acyl carrier protein n=1 Tax=Streptomyces sp. CC224B TaxID=3044571 RepID=UPI0024A8D826|nr:acyl carrier protein [Streptomyces sp. CC224B]